MGGGDAGVGDADVGVGASAGAVGGGIVSDAVIAPPDTFSSLGSEAYSAAAFTESRRCAASAPRVRTTR